MWKKSRLYLANGKVVLLGLTLVTILVANSPLSEWYWAMVNWPIGIGGETHAIVMPFSKWIKNGAMTVFFFLVAMEIKRECVDGQLSGLKKALAPVVGALGGMIIPALVFLALNRGGNWQGWAIPSATDIAFALACLTVLGQRIHPSISVLLVSIAIVDDLGAIAIVAFAYGSAITWEWALAGAMLASVGWGLNRWTAIPWAYGALCLISWVVWYKAGLSPTIAGVIVASWVPYHGHQGRYHRLEKTLSKWSYGLILPLFVVTHAGVTFHGALWETVATPECIGVMLGLCVGKPLGIVGGLWLGQWGKLISLPPVGWRGIIGMGCLGGIGFTMSLFITHLAYTDATLMARAQVGVLLGSMIAAIMGIGVLWHHQSVTHAPRKHHS